MRLYPVHPLFLLVLLLAGFVYFCSSAAADTGKWGFIDRNGKFVVPPRFDDATSFRLVGGAVVRLGDSYKLLDAGTRSLSDLPVTAADMQFFRDYKARQPLAAVAIGKGYGLKQDGKLIFNPHKPQYVAGMKVGFGSAKIRCAKFGNKYGYVRDDGTIALKPRWAQADDFDENTDLAPVQIGKKWGYINSKGAMVIKPIFEEAGIFHSWLAPVKVSRPSPVAVKQTQ
ncbi:MAG TPA: WG repeat-containing protein [Candidatus Obscuribacterales bacterium]